MVQDLGEHAQPNAGFNEEVTECQLLVHLSDLHSISISDRECYTSFFADKPLLEFRYEFYASSWIVEQLKTSLDIFNTHFLRLPLLAEQCRSRDQVACIS